MKYIAVLGFGIVGGGIPTVLELDKNKIEETLHDSVDIKYILDLRDIPDSPYGDRVVRDISVITSDPEVEVVCETMGGVHPAFEFSMACMKAGKSVVTSNKAVVAECGEELFECARENGVHYMIEASVGGGIPVLRSFATSLAGEEITKITGIVNGTTNYILTRMEETGLDFDSALKEAQELGFAERDPSADIDGIDAQRKLIILTALATGNLISGECVKTKTLRVMKSFDSNMKRHVKKLGGQIKLIAQAEIFPDNTLTMCVEPMVVRNESVLAHISDVFNGISVIGKTLGEVLYVGRGAGRIPTAGAVFADVLAVLSGSAAREKTPIIKKAAPDCGIVRDEGKISHDWLLIADAAQEEIKNVLEFTGAEVEKIEDGTFVVKGICEDELDGAVKEFGAFVIRIM